MNTGKFLLTSSGITTNQIQDALVALLGKPISETHALVVPTAFYAYPGGMTHAGQLVTDVGELNWNSLGILELTTLPDVPRDVWLPQLQAADLIMVGGGNAFYLSYWMERSGLFALLPQLLEQGTVYVGISAGSMMMTPALNFDQDRLEQSGIYHDDEFEEEMSFRAGSARTLGLVDFVIRPHLGADYYPQVTLENVGKWAAKAPHPLYAIDDQSALKVVNEQVEVVSSGTWKLFEKP